MRILLVTLLAGCASAVPIPEPASEPGPDREPDPTATTTKDAGAPAPEAVEAGTSTETGTAPAPTEYKSNGLAARTFWCNRVYSCGKVPVSTCQALTEDTSKACSVIEMQMCMKSIGDSALAANTATKLAVYCSTIEQVPTDCIECIAGL